MVFLWVSFLTSSKNCFKYELKTGDVNFFARVCPAEITSGCLNAHLVPDVPQAGQ